MNNRIGGKAKFGFGIGAVGKDVVYMLISSYLLYYYNSVLGMSSVFIGTVMMAARVFDALNDPIMGIIVAKTKTRWGRFRPWILAGTVLNAVTIYALYAAPTSNQKIWLTVFYLLWGVTYTLMDIPFWSMIPAITVPGKDRESLSSIARSCAGVGAAIPTVLTMIVVPVLSGSEVIADYKIGFRWWALIIAIFFIISEFVCVSCVKENVNSYENASAPSIGQMFKSLIKNDQALVVVVSIIFVYTALNIIGNLILYFFQYDVGNTDAYSGFVAVCFITQVVIMAVFPVFRKFASKNKLYIIGFLVQILGFLTLLAMAVSGLYGSNWIWLCIPGMLVYAGYGMLNVLLTIFLSDSVDYGQWKNGTRDESVIFSMQTFTVKLSAGLAVFLAGLIIDWIDLNTKAEVQAESTLNGLRMWITIPSIVLLIGGIIVFKIFYKLNDEKLSKITDELKKEVRYD